LHAIETKGFHSGTELEVPRFTAKLGEKNILSGIYTVTCSLILFA